MMWQSHRMVGTGWLLLSASLAAPASACRIPQPITALAMASQPVVIVGRVVHYRFVPNWHERRLHADSRWASPELRKDYLDPAHSFLFDTAQMTIVVDQVLKGNAPPSLDIDWAGGNTGVYRSVDARPLIIALHPDQSFWPKNAVQRRSASKLHLVDVMCGGPMMVDEAGPKAQEVRKLLAPPRR